LSCANCSPDSEAPKDPAANCSAEKSENDVCEGAIDPAPHHLSSKPACEPTNQSPRNESMLVLLAVSVGIFEFILSARQKDNDQPIRWTCFRRVLESAAVRGRNSRRIHKAAVQSLRKPAWVSRISSIWNGLSRDPPDVRRFVAICAGIFTRRWRPPGFELPAGTFVRSGGRANQN